MVEESNAKGKSRRCHLPSPNPTRLFPRFIARPLLPSTLQSGYKWPLVVNSPAVSASIGCNTAKTPERRGYPVEWLEGTRGRDILGCDDTSWGRKKKGITPDLLPLLLFNIAAFFALYCLRIGDTSHHFF